MSDSAETRTGRLTVLKYGGSVLNGLSAIQRVAAQLYQLANNDPTHRWVVVVSAERGTTDRLANEASQLCPDGDREALDLLWSTGETRTAALLALALAGRQVSTSALNVHQLGLRATRPTQGAARYLVNPGAIVERLREARVVIVPGFLALGTRQQVRTLGRGGSDLTAVLLAAGLRARCELIKDVPGYFDADPHAVIGARHLPQLTSSEALHLSRDGAGCVQPEALRAAEQAALPLTIRGFDPHGLRSEILPVRQAATRCESETVLTIPQTNEDVTKLEGAEV